MSEKIHIEYCDWCYDFKRSREQKFIQRIIESLENDDIEKLDGLINGHAKVNKLHKLQREWLNHISVCMKVKGEENQIQNNLSPHTRYRYASPKMNLDIDLVDDQENKINLHDTTGPSIYEPTC